MVGFDGSLGSVSEKVGKELGKQESYFLNYEEVVALLSWDPMSLL